MSTVTQMRIRRISLAALVVVGACTGGESSPARHTLVDSRDTYDPRSLDPALSTDVPTGRAVAYVFDGLVRFTPDAQIVPGLAREWTVSPDGLTYTFHLRSGVKFHDGRALKSLNVINSFMRALDPGTKGGRGWPLFPIAGAKEFADGKAKTDILKNVPAGRWAAEPEIEQALLFLLSGPSYITGEIIHLDGGRHLV